MLGSVLQAEIGLPLPLEQMSVLWRDIVRGRTVGASLVAPVAVLVGQGGTDGTGRRTS